MANKKRIEPENLIAPNVFQNTIKEARELLTVLNELEGQIKKTLSVSKGNISGNKISNAKDLEEYNSESAKANKLIEEYNKIAKQRATIEAQLNLLESEQNKELAVQKARLSDAKKEQQAKINLDKAEIGSLTQLIARNKQLVAERNKLNIFTKAGREEIKKINAEINKNNALIKENSSELEKQRLNVGNYKDAIVDALGSTDLFNGALGELKGIVGSLSGVFAGTIGQLKDITKNLLLTREQTAGLTRGQAALAQASNLVSKGFKLMGLAFKASGIGAAVAILTGIVSAFTQFEAGADRLEEFKLAAEGILQTVFIRLGKFVIGFKDFGKIISNEIQKLKLEFKLLGLTIADALPGIDKSKEIAEITKQIEELNKQDLSSLFDAFNGMGAEISDVLDKAKALAKEIDDFGRVSRLARLEIEKLNGKIAVLSLVSNDITRSFKERKEAQDELLKNQEKLLDKELLLAKTKLNEEIKLAAFRRRVSDEQIRSAITSQAAGGTIREKDLEALISYQNEVTKLENDQKIKKQENEIAKREIEQKELLTRINILRDYTNVELDLNNKIINNDKKNLDKRIQLFKDNTTLSKVAFEEQIKLIQESSGLTFDAQKLLAEKSATALEEEIVNIGLSEKVSKLLIDVINDRKKALDDLSNQQDNLLSTGAVDPLSPESFKRLDDYAKRLKENTDRLRKEKEKKDKEAEDLRKKREKEFRDDVARTTDLVINELNKRKDAEISNQESLIEKRKENITAQERLAEKGLANQLAFEQKKLAEAEAEKAKLEKEKRRNEKIQAYFKAFSAYLEENPNTAAQKALVQVLVAETIAGAFKDGVIDFQGDGTGTSDSNIVRISHGESVIKADSTAKFKPVLEDINDGRFDPWKYVPDISNKEVVIINQPYNDDLIKEMKEFNRNIKKVQTTNINWNSFGDIIAKTEENSVIKSIKYIRKQPKL